MSTQSFRKIKIDINDRLYSQIIRFGKEKCQMCRCVKLLQACHIMGRRHYTTRFTFYPRANAVALCADCHDWFDTHKMKAVLFDPSKRVFSSSEESYTWLVREAGYTWEEIQRLYVKSQGVMSPPYEWQKKEITKGLREILRNLNQAAALTERSRDGK